ncbi:Hsp20/alpha crystallin family protein [Methanohalophilus halophilus]|nr:Hsp20/alpha crystallin family protein [Methanohalophilus halophilus]
MERVNMAGKKKGNNPSGSDDSFSDITDMIEQMIQRFGVGIEEFSDEPFIYGFSITQRANEDPEIREFGNIPSDYNDFEEEIDPLDGPISIDEKKPLIDVLEMDGEVYVTAEISGMSRDDISVCATDQYLEINASNKHYTYSETLEMPIKVDPNSAKATFHNGVLEVIFSVMEESGKVDIKIN